MLIHLGDDEFINLNQCIAIVNPATIDPGTRERFNRPLTARLGREPKAAVLTTAGKWVGSTLSAESLAGRGTTDPFAQAWYRRPESPDEP